MTKVSSTIRNNSEWEVKFAFIPRLIGNDFVWFAPFVQKTVRGVDGSKRIIYDGSISLLQ